MPDPEVEKPLDLSLFDDLKPAPPGVESARAVAVVPTEDPRLAPMPPPPRLVDASKLSPDELAAAGQVAASGQFPRYRVAAVARRWRAG
jgi:hypothetical protein